MAITRYGNGMDSSGSGNSSNISATEDISIKEYTALELYQDAKSIAGTSLFYMQFLRSESDWGGDARSRESLKSQKDRIGRMCYHLAAEYQSHLEDTEDNRQWFRDWIEKFQAETENQC